MTLVDADNLHSFHPLPSPRRWSHRISLPFLTKPILTRSPPRKAPAPEIHSPHRRAFEIARYAPQQSQVSLAVSAKPAESVITVASSICTSEYETAAETFSPRAFGDSFIDLSPDEIFFEEEESSEAFSLSPQSRTQEIHNAVALTPDSRSTSGDGEGDLPTPEPPSVRIHSLSTECFVLTYHF